MIFEATIRKTLGILGFLLVWQLAAGQVKTSLGQFPGPAQVWEQAQVRSSMWRPVA